MKIIIKNPCKDCRFEKEGGICADCWKAERVKETTRIKLLKYLDGNMNDENYEDFESYIMENLKSYAVWENGEMVGIKDNNDVLYFKNYKTEKNKKKEERIIKEILEERYLNSETAKLEQEEWENELDSMNRDYEYSRI